MLANSDRRQSVTPVTEKFWRELAHLVCYRPAMSASSHNRPAGQGQNGREIFRINPPGLRRVCILIVSPIANGCGARRLRRFNVASL